MTQGMGVDMMLTVVERPRLRALRLANLTARERPGGQCSGCSGGSHHGRSSRWTTTRSGTAPMPDSDVGTCGRCGARVHHSDARAHLLTHGIDLERDATRWPDGEIVVRDRTLEPTDFEGDADA